MADLFATMHEPEHVRTLCDLECEKVFVAMRAGELDHPTAWDRVQEITELAEARLLELAGETTWADAAQWAPAPRWVASRLSDHQLASAVLRADGHYRAKVPWPLRQRLAASALTGLEPIRLIREYLVG